MRATHVSGFVLWFTGLSGAGKTTIANNVEPELRLETMGRTPGESAATVIDRLEELNLLPERVESGL